MDGNHDFLKNQYYYQLIHKSLANSFLPMNQSLVCFCLTPQHHSSELQLLSHACHVVIVW